MKRTRMRRVSAKKLAEAPRRREVVAEITARDKVCQAKAGYPEVACGGGFDGHEPLMRSGRSGVALDPEQVILVCRFHHRTIHENPARSYENGLLIHSWDAS